MAIGELVNRETEHIIINKYMNIIRQLSGRCLIPGTRRSGAR